jgi:hypothetical protein
MAKRLYNVGNSELEILDQREDLSEEDFFEVSAMEEENEELPKTIRIMLMIDMLLTCQGAVTGKTYQFNRGGSVVEVDRRDVENMLTKGRNTTSCCGSISSPYFEIVR